MKTSRQTIKSSLNNRTFKLDSVFFGTLCNKRPRAIMKLNKNTLSYLQFTKFPRTIHQYKHAMYCNKSDDK